MNLRHTKNGAIFEPPGILSLSFKMQLAYMRSCESIRPLLILLYRT